MGAGGGVWSGGPGKGGAGGVSGTYHPPEFATVSTE